MELMHTLLYWQIGITAVVAAFLGYFSFKDSKFKAGRSDGDYGAVFAWVLVIGLVAFGWLAWLIAYGLVWWLS